MLDENLITGLEETLRLARAKRERLASKMRKLQTEAIRLKKDISILDQTIAQTKLALGSLMRTSRIATDDWDDDDFAFDDNLDYSDSIRDGYDLEKKDDIYSAPQQRRGTPGPVTYLRKESRSKTPRRGVEQNHNRFTDRTITQACTLLLREHGGPLHVNELYDLLVEGGMQFTGNNPTISIAVSLNRNRRFNKVAPGTFDLMIKDASQAAS